VTRIRHRGGEFEKPAEVPVGSVVSVFRVPPESAGQRLDIFMRNELRRTSRSRTQHIIALSAFDPNGSRLRSNDRVRAEQQILLWRAPWDEDPVPTRIDICFEDEHFFAVDKPPNLPVHPSARYYNNTLIRMLQAARPGQHLSLVHRLDRETSGLLLVAKTPECDRALKRQLELRKGVEKIYDAITWGVPKDETGATSFRFERSVELDPKNIYRVKMKLGESENALYASTCFSVTATATVNEKTYARVRCVLETGRQHQIRLHLASLGTAIVGDKLYGPEESLFARGVDGELTPEDEALLEIPRHALHATELSIDHPFTKERLTIRSPLPEDMQSFWDSLS
jgi:23S rRNA pseudouridine1911/1915/1917 synthase